MKGRNCRSKSAHEALTEIALELDCPVRMPRTYGTAPTQVAVQLMAADLDRLGLTFNDEPDHPMWKLVQLHLEGMRS